MSVSVLADDPSSPDTDKNSPSPPALVPSEVKPIRKRSSTVGEGAPDRRNEALAFAKFLEVEEGRLKQEEPTASRISREKKLTAKWTGMTSRQRLAYLNPNSTVYHSTVIEVNFTAKENKKRKVEREEKGGFTAGIVVVPAANRKFSILRPGSAFNKPKVEEEFVLGDVGVPVAAVPTFKQPEPKIQNPQRLQRLASALGLGSSTASPSPVASPAARPMEPPRPRLFMTRAKPEQIAPPLHFAPAEVRPPTMAHPVRQEPHGPSTAKEALDMFYLALCAPAFPHPDESPLTPQNANFYYDAYIRLRQL